MRHTAPHRTARSSTLVAVFIAAPLICAFRVLSLHFPWRIPQARGARTTRT